MADKLNVNDLRETLGPKPGTCYRHKEGFLGGTDRLRICADSSVEYVYPDGSARKAYGWTPEDCERRATAGIWLRVPDAPKGGSQ